MKKSFSILLGLALAILLFVPTSALAEGEAYEYFDFKVNKVIGENIKNTDIRIYASVTSDPLNLTDRTEEFEVVSKMWSVCVDTDCSLSEEVSDDAVFEEGKDYVLMINIKGINEADINVWGTDRAKYNGTPIEELAGEYGNTGNELMIKTRTNVQESIQKEETKIEETKTEEEPVKEDKCLFGLSFCCTTFFGLSICIWILILLVIILLVILIIVIKRKKKINNQLSEI